jgi:hypothetical protein
MLFETGVRTCSRQCTVTERALLPGESYFSVLELQDGELSRLDYCVEAWQGAQDKCVGWWRARIPNTDEATPRLAPTDVMLNLFATLRDRAEDEEFRYLLGLLLMRRRVLRRVDSRLNDEDREVLLLHCSRRNEESEMLVAEPDAERAGQLQQRIVDLLYRGAEDSSSRTKEADTE